MKKKGQISDNGYLWVGTQIGRSERAIKGEFQIVNIFK